MTDYYDLSRRLERHDSLKTQWEAASRSDELIVKMKIHASAKVLAEIEVKVARGKPLYAEIIKTLHIGVMDSAKELSDKFGINADDLCKRMEKLNRDT